MSLKIKSFSELFKKNMLFILRDLEQRKDFIEALVFYSVYLLISFLLIGFALLFGIIANLFVQGEALEFTYNVSRIIAPIFIILISSYICYKKDILSQKYVILLILLSAFSSIFLLTILALFIQNALAQRQVFLEKIYKYNNMYKVTCSLFFNVFKFQKFIIYI